jgi:hypothetical protein
MMGATDHTHSPVGKRLHFCLSIDNRTDRQRGARFSLLLLFPHVRAGKNIHTKSDSE